MSPVSLPSSSGITSSNFGPQILFCQENDVDVLVNLNVTLFLLKQQKWMVLENE